MNSTHVVTNEVRLSFVHLFTPRANKPGDEPKYSVTLLVPKHDVATRQKIDAAMQLAVHEGTSGKWNGVRPPQIAFPIHDGDGVKPSDGMPFGDECKGHWVITASSRQTQKPEVVDANLNPILNQSEIYSGVYARVSIRFFAYNSAGKKGIGCGLGNVQKLRDGEPLGGRTSATSDFGAPAGFGAPAPQYQQHQYPAAPPAYPVAPVYAATPPAAPPAYGAVPYGAVPAGAVPYGAALAYPQNGYPPAPPQQAIDPITGRPVLGGVMGL